MEDAFCFGGSLGGKKGVDFFGVYDGHAGRDAATFISNNFPKLLDEKLTSSIEPLVALKTTFQDVNVKLKEHIGKSKSSAIKHCGSTALSCLLKDGNIFIANLGDTRAVLCRRKEAIRLSHDHKPGDEEEEDRIENLGGYVVVHSGGTMRINGQLAVSRAIGDFSIQPFVSDDSYVSQTKLTPDDNFIIAACDGVWDVLSDQECVNLALQESDPYKAALRIRDFAYFRGSDDNISVLVLMLK